MDKEGASRFANSRWDSNHYRRLRAHFAERMGHRPLAWCVAVFSTLLLWHITALRAADLDPRVPESRGTNLTRSLCSSIAAAYPTEEWQSCKGQLERPKLHAAVGTDRFTSYLVVGLPTALCRDENAIALLKTKDGGNSWSLLGTAEGAFTEAFFLTPDSGWILTHWASAASYPTLYRVEKDTFGRIEDAKDGIEKLVECPFTYAWNLVFSNEKEGMIQVACYKGLGVELPWRSGVRIMRTLDGGKGWSEWEEKDLPSWYDVMEVREEWSATKTHFRSNWHVDDELDRPTIYFQEGREVAKPILELPWPAENPCGSVSGKKRTGKPAKSE